MNSIRADALSFFSLNPSRQVAASRKSRKFEAQDFGSAQEFGGVGRVALVVVAL